MTCLWTFTRGRKRNEPEPRDLAQVTHYSGAILPVDAGQLRGFGPGFLFGRPMKTGTASTSPAAPAFHAVRAISARSIPYPVLGIQPGEERHPTKLESVEAFPAQAPDKGSVSDANSTHPLQLNSRNNSFHNIADGLLPSLPHWCAAAGCGDFIPPIQSPLFKINHVAHVHLSPVGSSVAGIEPKGEAFHGAGKEFHDGCHC